MASESEPSVKEPFGLSLCFSFSERKRSGNRCRNAGVISNPAAAKALPKSLRSPPPAGLTWQGEHLVRNSGRDSGSAAKIFRDLGRALAGFAGRGTKQSTAKKKDSKFFEIIFDIYLEPCFCFRFVLFP